VKPSTLHARTRNGLLLDIAAHNVDRVLGHDDIVILGLEHLLDGARIFVGVLDQDLFLGVGVLAQKCLAALGIGIVIEQNGHVTLYSNLGSMG